MAAIIAACLEFLSRLTYGSTKVMDSKATETPGNHEGCSGSNKSDGPPPPKDNPFLSPEYWKASEIIQSRFQNIADILLEHPEKLQEAMISGMMSAMGTLDFSEDIGAQSGDDAGTVRYVTAYLTSSLESIGDKLNLDERKAVATIVTLVTPFMKHAFSGRFQNSNDSDKNTNNDGSSSLVNFTDLFTTMLWKKNPYSGTDAVGIPLERIIKATLDSANSPSTTAFLLEPSSRLLEPDQTMKEYEYVPLKCSSSWIRLVEPCPGDPMEFKMCEFELSKAPDFFALSYVWGEITTDQPHIVIDGKSISVTKNLHRALSDLNSWILDTGKYIWVDALCINQNQTPEKNSQVDIMSDIYRKAKQVLAHLGPPPKKSSQVAKQVLAHVCYPQDESSFGRTPQLLERITEVASTTQSLFVAGLVEASSGKPLEEALAQKAVRLQEIGHEIPHLLPFIDGKSRDKAWEAILLFFRSQWWNRAWIVQEAAISGDLLLVYGDLAIPKTVVHSVLTYVGVQIKERETLPAMAIFETWARMPVNPSNRLPLLEAFDIVSRQNCKIPRDKIYAARGLAGSDETASIKTDYDQPLLDVLVQVVSSLLGTGETSRRLEFLGYVARPGVQVNTQESNQGSTNGSTESSLPSWLPDWTTPGYSTPREMQMSCKIRRRFDSFPIFPNAACRPRLSSNRILHLSGWVVDYIDSVFEEEDTLDCCSLSPMRDELDQVLELASESGKPGPASISVKEALDGEVSSFHVKDFISDQTRHTWEMQYGQTTSRKLFEDITMKSFKARFKTILKGHRIASTKNVHGALVPCLAQKNDLLCSFIGGLVYYVIRPEGNEPDTFTFVGEAYIFLQMNNLSREETPKQFKLV